MALPVADIVRPAVLGGTVNGRLPGSILVDVKGLNGTETVRLVKPAALAWQAMTAAALKAGIALTVSDSYRDYAAQERIFRERYTTTRLAGRPTRQWNGQTWWQKPGTAAAAVPGTSNHGWALAVDMRLLSGVLAWLLANAARFGFSWEIQSEAWHLRYVAGDRLPDAVAAHTGPVAPPPTPGDGRMFHPTIAGRADDVWTDSDGHVWHQFYDPKRGWSAKEQLGGAGNVIARDLAAGWRPDGGQYRVAGTGPDGKRYETVFDATGGRWSGWRPVGQ